MQLPQSLFKLAIDLIERMNQERKQDATCIHNVHQIIFVIHFPSLLLMSANWEVVSLYSSLP